ncbi:MAG: hypothetical protein ACLP0J_28710 [Solirubrobacteraceae bacterium]
MTAHRCQRTFVRVWRGALDNRLLVVEPEASSRKGIPLGDTPGGSGIPDAASPAGVP